MSVEPCVGGVDGQEFDSPHLHSVLGAGNVVGSFFIFYVIAVMLMMTVNCE